MDTFDSVRAGLNFDDPKVAKTQQTYSLQVLQTLQTFKATRDQLPNFGAAPTSPGRLQAQFGNTLGAGVLTPEELAQSGRIGTRRAEDFMSSMYMPGTAEDKNKVGNTIAGMDEATFLSLNPDAQQKILNDIRTADMGTTFTNIDSQPNYRTDSSLQTALETMEGRVGPTDTVFDIDTRDTRNFVGDDFAPALDIVDARQQSLNPIEFSDTDSRLNPIEFSDTDNTVSTLTRPEDYEENVGRSI